MKNGRVTYLNIVVAISGASGIIYGIRILEELKRQKVDTHLVVSKWGARILESETNCTFEYVRSLASSCYDEDDLSAPISSGSYRWEGMVIAPCSMKTLSGISSGYSSNLILRAAPA